MREVLLDDLIKWETGANTGRINWNKSIGRSIRFIYDDISGEAKILDYNNKYITLKYNDNVADIFYGDLKRCRIGSLVGRNSREHNYKINEIIEDVMSGKLKILEQIRFGKMNQRGYKYECLICGNVDKISEYAIAKRNGCGVCGGGSKVLRGYNDIHTVDLELGKLLWDHEDGYKYSLGCSQKLDFKCPECGLKIENKNILKIHNRGLSCPRCSDGISYPNKLMYNVLSQINCEFECEKQFNWSKNKKYDFHCSSLNFTIEMHGVQHYKDIRRKNGNRNFTEEIENDKLKEMLHKENVSARYIVIRADKSELEYIRDGILNSDLSKIINLSSVDWTKCENDSQKSLVKIACDIYNKNNQTTTEISKQLKVSNVTIITYLKRGAKLGWCEYDSKKEMRKSGLKASERSKKPVIRFTLNGDYIDEFDSAAEAARQLSIHPTNISHACNGKVKSAYSFKWMYKADHKEQIKSVV